MSNSIKIVIALIIGLVAGYLVGANQALAPTDSSDLEEGATAEEQTGGTSAGQIVPGAKNVIVVFDQAPAPKVIVSKVVLENRSWIAIHDDINGVPGKIMGAARFPAGAWQGEIDLLRSTFAGGKFYAMIHVDDGDDVFDHTKDLPLKDDKGQPIMAVFSVREGAVVPTDIVI